MDEAFHLCIDARDGHLEAGEQEVDVVNHDVDHHPAALVQVAKPPHGPRRHHASPVCPGCRNLSNSSCIHHLFDLHVVWEEAEDVCYHQLQPGCFGGMNHPVRIAQGES